MDGTTDQGADHGASSIPTAQHGSIASRVGLRAAHDSQCLAEAHEWALLVVEWP